MTNAAPNLMRQPERALRQLAAAAGFASLAKLAAAADISRFTVMNAVHGKRVPTRGSVRLLAAALGVAPELVAAIFANARAE